MVHSRTKAEFLGEYAAGWTEGNVDKILEAAALSYAYDDPTVGHTIHGLEFRRYFADLSGQVHKLRGPNHQSHFMDISELVTKEEGGVVTAWCWWHIPGTHIQGCGLIKVGDGGVLSEKLAFYTKPGQPTVHA